MVNDAKITSQYPIWVHVREETHTEKILESVHELEAFVGTSHEVAQTTSVRCFTEPLKRSTDKQRLMALTVTLTLNTFTGFGLTAR
jgi:hypothetical protein